MNQRLMSHGERGLQWTDQMKRREGRQEMQATLPAMKGGAWHATIQHPSASKARIFSSDKRPLPRAQATNGQKVTLLKRKERVPESKAHILPPTQSVQLPSISPRLSLSLTEQSLPHSRQIILHLHTRPHSFIQHSQLFEPTTGDTFAV